MNPTFRDNKILTPPVHALLLNSDTQSMNPTFRYTCWSTKNVPLHKKTPLNSSLSLSFLLRRRTNLSPLFYSNPFSHLCRTKKKGESENPKFRYQLKEKEREKESLPTFPGGIHIAFKHINKISLPPPPDFTRRVFFTLPRHKLIPTPSPQWKKPPLSPLSLSFSSARIFQFPRKIRARERDLIPLPVVRI